MEIPAEVHLPPGTATTAAAAVRDEEKAGQGHTEVAADSPSVGSTTIDEEELSGGRRTGGGGTRGPDDHGDHHPAAGDGIARQPTDPNSYPEGGLVAWGVVLGSWSGLAACFGLLNSIGAFQEYVSTGPLRDYSPGAIGWIFSVYVFLSFFCGVLFGPIFDTHGPRWLILLGSVLLITAVMLLSLATKYWHWMLSFGVMAGVGSSFIFTPAFTAPGHYFRKKRGEATGIATTGGSVGGVIFPLVLDRTIRRIGFPWAVRVLGFVMLFLTVLANLLIRSRLPPLPGSNSRPDLTILRKPAFACITAGAFLMEIGLFVPLTYVTSYAVGEGISKSLAYQLLAMLNAGSFFGRWLSGYVADKIGRFNTLVIFDFLCLACTAGLWFPAGGSAPILIVYVIIYGFASGSNISLTPVCVGQLCRTEQYGRYYATCYMVVSFGTLVGIPIAGEILKSNGGDYWGLIVFTMSAYVGSLVLIVMARGLASDWKIKTVF